MSAWQRGLGLGAIALAAAIASGSRPLGVVGVGFLLACGLTWLWMRLAGLPVSLSLDVRPQDVREGDRVSLAVEIRRTSRVPFGSSSVELAAGRLGRRSQRLRGHGRLLTTRIDLGPVPRGVYTIDEAEVVVGDLLGLASVTPSVAFETTTFVVRPRLVALDGLFCDSGVVGSEGRRLLLRRAAGFDFHSVREYEQGESLRRVHWPTSARRGQLMVKELEDTSHDGVVVVLDCEAAGAVGMPPDSSFDAAVRAAGSILRAHAARGRMATLVSTGTGSGAIQVRTAHPDLGGAMTALAAAVADAPYGLARVLGQLPARGTGGELTIVTATRDPAAFARVLTLTGRRPVSLVWVDAASFAARPTRAEPGLLRLAGHGVPTAVVRRGDDLAAALSGRVLGAAAHG
jgi:uncharacterized protein (DUF58 family)